MNRNHALRRARRGNTFVLVLLALFVLAVVGTLGWWFFGRGAQDEGPQVLVNKVSRGTFEYVVLEQGEVESANNIELRCEVKSRTGGGSSGITILSVVPEGTMVQAGDILVKLDSSALELERGTQQIKVNSQQALVVQSENTWEAAKIARKEYLEGTFLQEEKLIMAEVFVGEQNLRSAQLAFESAQRLAAKNIVTGLQLEGAQAAVDKARNELGAAQTKLAVLRKYTKEKMLKQFDSDIATAEAKVGAEKSSLNLEVEKLRDIEDQIGKCTLRAPAPGQVVYANKYNSSSRGGSSSAEFVVEAGATVREQQPIIRLPNSNEMQVKALINEARVTLVRAGLPVSIRVDALKDEQIEGQVTKVNQYAEPGGWSSGSIKKYAAFIKILNPPVALRSGMNAEVRIHVERKSDALQVPVQALAEHKGHFFALVQNGDRYETREVEVSSTNDKVAVIDKGLGENDVVVMNPRGQGSLLVLPKLADPTPVELADIKRAAPVVNPAALAGNSAAPGGAAGEPKAKRPPTAASMVSRAFDENDTDKDGKLSQSEIDAMDERRKQMFAAADTTGDGFIDQSEATVAAAQAIQRMRERAGPGGSADGGPGGPPTATGGGGQ
ncbi:MAG: HlyD family efflux transporter periplasmic adaptor subunit [Pirellulaceae bacterium]|nr:HlyD family efflux transporter periplasmic adaptor subunit [Pirellulaceae bacterium]